MIKRLAGTAFLGLVAAACGGDDQQPPPATPAPTVTAPPPPVDTTPVDAAAPPPKMSMADMQAAVAKGFMAKALDPAKVAAMFAPDGVESNIGMPANQGRDAIQADHAKLAANYPDMTGGIVRTWTKGNQMVIQWVMNATDKASGKKLGLNGVDVIALNDDGLITTDRSYFNVETILKQTGAYVGQTPVSAVPAIPTSTETHVGKNDDTEAKNQAAIVALNAALAKKDNKTYFAGLTDDYTTYDDSDELLPHDKKWLTGNLAAFQKAADVTAYKDTNTIAVEDFTIDESELSMTQKAAYSFGKYKIANTKKSATTHGVEIDQWKDGKIVKSWSFENPMELDSQLGIGPAAPAKADKVMMPAAKAAKPASKP